MKQFFKRFKKQTTKKVLKYCLIRAQTKDISTLKVKKLYLTSNIKPNIKRQSNNILNKIIKGFKENNNKINLSQILKNKA